MINVRWECNGHNGTKLCKDDKAAFQFAKKLYDVFMTSDITAKDGKYTFLKVTYENNDNSQQVS